MDNHAFQQDGMTRIMVLQGQARVSAGPRVEFSTVLGSCVATCLYDPEAQVGGMNHFLLAEPPSGLSGGDVDVHYGVYLMEVLINAMLEQGASKQRLKAHLYGGANLHQGMARIGTKNAEFARRFLADERIALVHEDLGGEVARRVHFLPALGKVRCRTVETEQAPREAPIARPRVAAGEVELF